MFSARAPPQTQSYNLLTTWKGPKMERKIMKSHRIAAMVFCLLARAPQAAPAQPGRFTMTTLPAWHGMPFEPYALNDHGQIAGLIHLGDGKWHLFLWERGSGLKDLDSVYPSPCDINNHGQIVGTRIGAGDRPQAFLRAPDGTMEILGDLGGGFSEAAAINNQGQVVGQSLDGERRAFIWDRAHGMRSLEVPGRFRTRAGAISDTGQVFGSLEYWEDIRPRHRPCCWDLATSASPMAIGPPSHDFFAMNSKGWVVGTYTFRNGDCYVVLWQVQGGIERLYACGSDDGMYGRSTWMVNDANQVVCIEEERQQWGEAEMRTGSGQARRYFWDRAGGKIPLDAYLPRETQRFDLRDFNNRGCILGIAHLEKNDRRVPLLLEPK